MKVIGLTGNIASGKSSVSKILKGLGAYIIDADIVAREVTKKGEVAWMRIKEHFGKQYIAVDGEIDRKRLGELVFSSPGALGELNAIVHPIIVKRINDKLKRLKEEDIYEVVVIDAALLIETGCHDIVDEIWVVTLPKDMQIDRLIKRDRLTKKQATDRIESQMPQSEKIKLADRVIDNSKELSHTKEQVYCIWNEIMH